MTRVEVPRGESDVLFIDDGFLTRREVVNEIKQLIGDLAHADNNNVLRDKIISAQQILIIGPGPSAPEIDLFFSEVDFNADGTVSLTIPEKVKIVLVEKDEIYEEIRPEIYKLTTRIPNIEIHLGVTIDEYSGNRTSLFDLILYLRTEVLRDGQQPEELGGYLRQLLKEEGLAVVTGDQEGIDRLIVNTSGVLSVITRADNLPEGSYEGGFSGHSGVVLSK